MFFKKKKPKLSEQQKRWNTLWEQYGTGELKEQNFGIYCLCDYYSGVNGEGHAGWLDNTENTEGKEAINNIVSALEEVLPDHLYDNLKRALLSYGTEKEDNVCEKADDYFCEHEKEIIEHLQKAAEMKL